MSEAAKDPVEQYKGEFQQSSDVAIWQIEAFEQFPDAVMVLDSDRTIRALNNKACELLGVSAEAVVGESCTSACMCGRGEQDCLVLKASEDGKTITEIGTKLISKLKKVVSMEITAVPIRNRKGVVIGGIEIVRDVTAMGDFQRKLQIMADTDDLTGLSRRRIFFAALERETARYDRHGRSFSVLMVDVDDFKQYNDTFGHQAGDELLKMISGILKEEGRSEDTVARYGGEEFAILLVETELDRAKAAAERILDKIRRNTPSVTVDGKLRTVSIGISSCDSENPCTPHSMVKSADDALYAAKFEGKDRVVVPVGL